MPQKDDRFEIRQLREEIMELERVVLALARREDGLLTLTEAELTDLPPGSSIARVDYPDGRTVFKVVSDALGQPGRAG